MWTCDHSQRPVFWFSLREERLSANPELVGGTAMDLLDAVVEALTKAEVITILNNHVSSAQWCCHPEDGLWYTDKVTFSNILL